MEADSTAVKTSYVGTRIATTMGLLFASAIGAIFKVFVAVAAMEIQDRAVGVPDKPYKALTGHDKLIFLGENFAFMLMTMGAASLVFGWSLRKLSEYMMPTNKLHNILRKAHNRGNGPSSFYAFLMPWLFSQQRRKIIDTCIPFAIEIGKRC